MYLSKIKDISEKMSEKNLLLVSFPFIFNEINFEILFFNLDEKILVIKKNSKDFLSILITDNFNVSTKLNKEDYYILTQLVEFKYYKDKEFKPSIFFIDLFSKIPSFEKTTPLKAKYSLKYIKDYIEDIYSTEHLGFVNHKDNKVSRHNLNKTLVFLGKKEYERCKKNNISSTWRKK